jgi:hypothetical protein
MSDKPKWYRVCVHGESVTIKGYDAALKEALRSMKVRPAWRVQILDMQTYEYVWDSAEQQEV